MAMGSTEAKNDMQVVTVNKDELLSALKANRDKHAKEFEEVQLAYERSVVEALEEALARAKDGVEFKTWFQDLTVPESHVKEYDRVIKMLEMSVKSEITIDSTQFNQYVMDEWGWRRGFEAVSAAYSKKA